MSSKIKVDTIENVAGSGNVSLGSGHNLVVPGNNSTTGNATVGGTLGVTGATTLTGDLAVDTSTLKVDSSNNRVGVGTASPTVSLDVTSSGNNFILVKDSSSGSGLYLKAASNGAAEIQTAGGNNTIGFRTNGQERCHINSSGVVTMSEQPSFAGSWNNNRAPGQILKGGDHQDHNVGNHYNNSTGLWTAPVTGKYYVSILCMTNQAGGGTLDIELQKNGGDYQLLVPYAQVSGNIHIHVSGSAIVHLAANDTLGWYINTGTIYGSSSGRHGNMSFRLLG